MKIYLASGYGVMNTKGKERDLLSKFIPYRRLVSYFDLERGNQILNSMYASYEKKK